VPEASRSRRAGMEEGQGWGAGYLQPTLTAERFTAPKARRFLRRECKQEIKPYPGGVNEGTHPVGSHHPHRTKTSNRLTNGGIKPVTNFLPSSSHNLIQRNAMNPVWTGLLVILALLIWWTISYHVSFSFRGYGSIGNLKRKPKTKASSSSRKPVPKGAKSTTLVAALGWLEKNQSAVKYISTPDQKAVLEVRSSTDGHRVLLISAYPQLGLEQRVSKLVLDQDSEPSITVQRVADGNLEIKVSTLPQVAKLAKYIATHEWSLSEMDTVLRWGEARY